MKRLEKSQISELRKAMPVLDCQELQSFIGGNGKKYYFNDSGQIDSSLTEDFEASGTFDKIVVNGHEMQLKGCVSTDSNGNVSFEGDAALYEFMVQNTSSEWGYGWNSGCETGMIGTSGEEHGGSLPGSSWKQYDNFAHSHNTNLDIPEWQKDEINGLPSQADIDDLISTNAWRKRHGLPPQNGLIYNERTGKWEEFDEKSTTQQEYLESHDYR